MLSELEVDMQLIRQSFVVRFDITLGLSKFSVSSSAKKHG